jgi:hypothetical protein
MEELLDILFYVGDSEVGVTFTVDFQTEGETGNPGFIEPQTIFYEIRIPGGIGELVTIF